MTRDELINVINGEVPVLCRDGRMGLVTVTAKDRCGVQVPGEPEHRWMSYDDIDHLHGGAMAEKGAPRAPLTPSQVGNDARGIHFIIACAWAKRGAQAVLDRLEGKKE